MRAKLVLFFHIIKVKENLFLEAKFKCIHLLYFQLLILPLQQTFNF